MGMQLSQETATNAPESCGFNPRSSINWACWHTPVIPVLSGTGGSEGQGHLWLYTEFEIRLEYILYK